MQEFALIADSGSTKTDWRLVSASDLVITLEGIGLNPDFHSLESIVKEFNRLLSQFDGIVPTEIYFYGSGASSPSRKAPLEKAFNQLFPNAKILVEHDLMGASIAAHGDQEGLVGILGTGSNCCHFNGKMIVKEFRSGGFILSDEGGGVEVGKMILKAFIEDYLDQDLREDFINTYNLDVDKILHAMYKESRPNTFIASFSRFAKTHETHPQIAEMIRKNFDNFFLNKVCRFDNFLNLELAVVGSMAQHFEQQLRESADRFNVSLGKIVMRPIDEIVKFHQSRLGSGK